ncbi:MAG: TlpA family protein disulfide reductase [Acidimicrobiia bacterium]|nr:TlpA family protein disulfide reductase [Acidimicrobiia bacterium]
MRKLLTVGAIAFGLILGGCGGEDVEPAGGALPVTNAGEFEQLLADSESPMVVNLWASWCIPCRSEAPLLTEAHRQLGDEIRFIGVATEDSQVDAEAFVAEFSMTFENYFDRSGEVKGWIGSLGLPTTFFVAPGGEIVSTVFGVIDERRLALEIDELLRR